MQVGIHCCQWHDTPLLLLAGNTENNCDDLFKYPVASMFHRDRLTDTQKDIVQ